VELALIQANANLGREREALRVEGPVQAECATANARYSRLKRRGLSIRSDLGKGRNEGLQFLLPTGER